jgi:hypothetical protein
MVYERLQKLKNESGQSILACNALVWLDIARRTQGASESKDHVLFCDCVTLQNSDTINYYNLEGSSTRIFIPRPRTEFSYSGA